METRSPVARLEMMCSPGHNSASSCTGPLHRQGFALPPRNAAFHHSHPEDGKGQTHPNSIAMATTRRGQWNNYRINLRAPAIDPKNAPEWPILAGLQRWGCLSLASLSLWIRLSPRAAVPSFLVSAFQFLV